MATAKINAKNQINQILSVLSGKNRAILERRFGIASGELETLESIGRSYGITRERVRQIQEYGLKKLRSDATKNILAPAFFLVENYININNGVSSESGLFNSLASQSAHPHLSLILKLMPNIFYENETSGISARYALDKRYLSSADSFLNNLHKTIEKNGQPMAMAQIKEIAQESISFSYPELAGSLDNLLALSKKIKKGPFGEYGLVDWPAIRPRGVRDRAYLVFGKEGRPIHFKELSVLIDKYFKEAAAKRGTHSQTVHNELIKDPRFVLVGRGLYGLGEWGYEPGTVKDVLVRIFQEQKKPLLKEEILELLSQKRFVKTNTVFLNLQNKDYFARQKNGKYYLA